jgi:hypothetical protein
LLASSFVGCKCVRDSGPFDSGEGGGAGGGGGSGGGFAPSTPCVPCVTTADCAPGSQCAQFSGDAFCGVMCTGSAECGAGETCQAATTFNGQQVKVCLPGSGVCAPPVDGGSCGPCTAGTSCDPPTGLCVQDVDAGPPDAGACGTFLPPATPSCCHSCVAGTGSCQSNGCYGGWWCDTAASPSCYCRPPPTSCTGGNEDAGVFDAGVFAAGFADDGGVGVNGGTVDHLFFAVVGDTRPANPDDTASYPTAVITKIYADLAAMNPRPQFVITTGDYQFSGPYGNQAAVQLALYQGARAQYPGPVFAAMGNHECSGATASNCVGNFPGRNNYDAFIARLVTPLGRMTPYYAIPVQTAAGSVSFILTACNAWDATQKAWLRGMLAQPTDFKFIVRHEPYSTYAPCTAEMNPMLQNAAYDMFLVGHAHDFFRVGNELVVGMGGAPTSGTTPFGYITIEQQSDRSWKVIQYDSATSLPVTTFSVP